jgi:hypothetical protein
VRHHVHIPAAFPVRVRRLFAAIDGDAGIRTEQIDRAVPADSVSDQTSEIGFLRDVGENADPPISAASRCAASPSMSATTTAFAPSAANLRHSAAPIPFAPPVTTMTLSR